MQENEFRSTGKYREFQVSDWWLSWIDLFLFRKLFPNYTEYSDYASYVNEIKNDGYAKDIMGVDYPIALTNTSGTSGDPKNFPV